MTSVNILLQLSTNTYNDGVSEDIDGQILPNITTTVGTYIPRSSQGFVDTVTGFSARAHYSADDKTLVITFTGTNGDDTLNANLHLASGVHPDNITQFQQAVNYAREQIELAKADYPDAVENIVFTGHSLGGALASYTQTELDVGSATVFNAPGFGSTFEATNAPVTYIYSDPSTWEDNLSLAGLADSQDVHNLGDRVSEDIWFLMDADSHGIGETNTSGDYLGDPGLLGAYNSGDRLISLDQFLDLWAAEITAAEATPYPPIQSGNPFVSQALQKYKLDDYRSEAAERALGNDCFPAGTLITMGDGSSKPIETITQSDIVLAPDALGELVPSKVTKLFTNTTQEFIRLSFPDGRDDLTATPGHHFLSETGDYMEIGAPEMKTGWREVDVGMLAFVRNGKNAGMIGVWQAYGISMANVGRAKG